MELPVFILAYANDKSNSLKYLQKEHKEITEYFLNIKDRVQLIQMPETSIKDLFKQFLALKDDIIGFHFSGHADEDNLYFKDESKGNMEGLAELLKLAPKLEFAFLNGCATFPQVESLHSAGAKSVVATSRKVFDEIAANFSIYFYAALSRSWTVGKAFNYAKSFIITDENVSSAIFKGKSRYIQNEYSEIEVSTDEFPWGIYFNEFLSEKDRNKFEDWTLPEKPIWEPQEVEYTPSEHLITSMAKHAEGYYNFIKDEADLDDTFKKEFQSIISFYNKKFTGTENQLRKLADKIKSLMPFPLAIKFQIMQRWSIAIGRDRSRSNYFELLGSQLSFYKSVTQLWALIMLSDLFNIIEHEYIENLEAVDITQGQWEILNQYFQLNEETVNGFDFTTLSKSVRQIIEKSPKTPFLDEYKMVRDNFQQADILFEIHMEFVGIETRLKEKRINQTEIIALCKKVEEKLWHVFEKVYFLLKYKLVVIKKIEIIRFRNEKAMYDHNVLFFKKAKRIEDDDDDDDDDYDDNLSNTEEFTDSYSVLLIKAIKSFTKFLNLSPFIMDLNVLTEIGEKQQSGKDETQLYIYSYSTDSDGRVYNQVENPSHVLKLKFKNKILANHNDAAFNTCDYIDTIKPKPYPALENKIAVRLSSLDYQFKKFKNIISSLVPK